MAATVHKHIVPKHICFFIVFFALFFRSAFEIPVLSAGASLTEIYFGGILQASEACQHEVVVRDDLRAGEYLVTGGGVCVTHEGHPIVAAVCAAHRAVDAPLGGEAAHEEVLDAQLQQPSIELGAVEGIGARFGDNQFVLLGSHRLVDALTHCAGGEGALLGAYVLDEDDGHAALSGAGHQVRNVAQKSLFIVQRLREFEDPGEQVHHQQPIFHRNAPSCIAFARARSHGLALGRQSPFAPLTTIPAVVGAIMGTLCVPCSRDTKSNIRT